MYISYDYYRIFYYVAKYGNITQAAKLLLNNQPNLTRSIKNLESELGCPLFLRSHSGMKLTPEGERLYSHIRIAFEHIEAGEAELTESRNMQTGTVYVAASEVALHCLLLPVLKKYRMLYPGIHIKISNHSTPQAVAALREGTADIAVVTTPTVRSASLSETTVKPVNEVAVCSKSFSSLSAEKSLFPSLLIILLSHSVRIQNPLNFIPSFSQLTDCRFNRTLKPSPQIKSCPWSKLISESALFPRNFCRRKAALA